MRSRSLPFLAVLVAACSGTQPAAPLVTSQVSWPAPGALDRPLRDALPAALRAQVDGASVPVLLPRGVAYARAHLVVQPVYYALSAPGDGATVTLQASRQAYRHEAVPAHPGDRRLRGTTGFVTVNEGIRTAAWIENGVAYALDLECADPTDVRCADDASLLGLVEGLGYVGGRP